MSLIKETIKTTKTFVYKYGYSECVTQEVVDLVNWFEAEEAFNYEYDDLYDEIFEKATNAGMSDDQICVLELMTGY